MQRLGLLIAGAVLVWACGGQTDEDRARGTHGEAAGGNGGGDDSTSASGAGAIEPDPVCHVATEGPYPISRINLVLLLDQSSSMHETVNGSSSVTRWDVVQEGMSAFLSDPGSTLDRFRAALQFFPVDGDLARVCSVSSYQQPAVPLTPLDGDIGPVLTALEGATGGGSSPLRPALQGAIDYGMQMAFELRADKTVVVLVTTGRPGFQSETGELLPGCDDNGIEHVAAVARAGFEGTPRILTYVLGFGSDIESLDAIARAGGTTTAIMARETHPAGATEGFGEALMTLREQFVWISTVYLSCEVSLQDLAGDARVDLTNIRVQLADLESDETQTIPYSEGCLDGVGWQYSEFDEEGLPTVIEFCPNTCAEVQGDLHERRIEFFFGCE